MRLRYSSSIVAASSYQLCIVVASRLHHRCIGAKSPQRGRCLSSLRFMSLVVCAVTLQLHTCTTTTLAANLHDLLRATNLVSTPAMAYTVSREFQICHFSACSLSELSFSEFRLPLFRITYYFYFSSELSFFRLQEVAYES